MAASLLKGLASASPFSKSGMRKLEVEEKEQDKLQTQTPTPATKEPAETSEAQGSVAVVPREDLYVSEPEPVWFGNDPNLQKGQAGAKFWSNGNWLKSRFHFRFAEAHTGPSRFGVLRVMNDDLVQPLRGFGTHPHENMEIITLVVDGELTHKDSMGENETLGRGSLQFMSAGTGVSHSEHNWNERKPLRFIQCWVLPRKQGLRPNYGSLPGGPAAAEARANRWAHLVSDRAGGLSAPVQINQDCNVFLTELSPEADLGGFELRSSRQAYLLCVEGEASLAGTAVTLRRHDAAELKGPLTMSWKAGGSGAMLLLFEMALTPHSRFGKSLDMGFLRA